MYLREINPKLRYLSPAKLNLTLRIVSKKVNGYHEIASIFQAIDLFDEISFSFAEEDILTCNEFSLPLGRENLIWRAVDLFKTKTNLSFKLDIHLQKNIPQEAGLGGGSSNAATTLFALNHMCGYPATETQLRLWATELGSDPPFFFSTGRAFYTGIGDKVDSLEPIEGKCLVVKPHGGLSTKKMFDLFDERKEHLSLQNNTYFNDFEEVAFYLRPDLYNLKHELLESGFDVVCLTGSGSAFFCIGDGHYKGDLPSYQVNFLPRTNNGEWYKNIG